METTTLKSTFSTNTYLVHFSSPYLQMNEWIKTSKEIHIQIFTINNYESHGIINRAVLYCFKSKPKHVKICGNLCVNLRKRICILRYAID